MNFNSSGYFAYKKNKIQSEAEGQKGTISKLNFLFQLFIATFIIMFIIIVITIMRYSSKMDIEYSKGELQTSGGVYDNTPVYTPPIIEEERQRQIDKRLILIQQEENAPSEAKIISKPKNIDEVIDSSHLEENKKLEKQEKIEKLKQANETIDNKTNKLTSFLEEVKLQKKVEVEPVVDQNVTIMSKVLIGRYQTFEEAHELQVKIKDKNPTLKPFVRKIGNVYTIQMGSYKDFSVAKEYASHLRDRGLDVWIYQQ